MRILIVADIHANWSALQAIQEPHDLCLCLGDLVDYGLEPGPCIEWVRRHAQHCVRGNHDHAAAQRATTNGKAGFKYLSGITRHVTWEKLKPADLRYLAGLPVTQMLTIGEKRFLLVHATPRDPLDEYVGNDVEIWTRRLQNVQADYILVGHTHHPFVLDVNGKTVVNPGSVGQPRDGDPRASYAIWEDGKIELKRAAYPVDEVVKLFEASNLPELAKQMSIEVFRTGGTPTSTNGQ